MVGDAKPIPPRQTDGKGAVAHVCDCRIGRTRNPNTVVSPVVSVEGTVQLLKVISLGALIHRLH